ncbi:TPA: hypothetical protein ACG1DY_004996 [Escherichia coli]
MIEKILKRIGITLMVLSVVGALIGLFSIDHDAYRSAKEIADELWDNTIAQEQYAAIRSAYLIELSMVIVSLFSGIIGGLILMGFGTLIHLQRETLYQSEKQTKMLEYNTFKVEIEPK